MNIVYARYSDRKQDGSLTIEYQDRKCREHLEGEGIRGEVRLFPDRAVSGRSFERPACDAMCDAARAGLVEVIICYDWRRLGRNAADGIRWADIFESWGIRVISVAQGEDRFVRNLTLVVAEEESRYKARTVSGRREEYARCGLWMGAAPFAYRLIKTQDDHRDLEIIKGKVWVVCRLGELYVSGLGYSCVGQELNRLGIPSPRGKLWDSATVRLILNNSIYYGVMIQCRVRNVLDPETNKVRKVERPVSEHIIVERPDLRIIPEELEAKIKAELKKNAAAFQRSGLKGTRRPKLPLSGLVKCATCGSSYISRPKGSGGRFFCCGTRHKSRAACDNGVYVPADRLLAQLIEGLEANVWTETNVQRAIRAGWRLAQKIQGADSNREARLAEVERGLERLVRLAEQGKQSIEVVARRIGELEAEKAELAGPRQPKLTRADVEREVRQQIGRTQELLHELRNGADPTAAEYRQILRSLVQEVRVYGDRKVVVRAALSPLTMTESPVFRASVRSR